MEINLKELSKNVAESTTGERKMRLSDDAQSMVFQLFTKNVYSNPIGTVVREITSNCFDSHIEAKVNEPVIIKKFIDNQTNTIYISFIDFGVGMSPERIENIYSVYFESTKRIDNTQIGGFGIGGKTPLAYKRSTGHGEGEYDNSFYVITIFNGIKYYYCVFEGKESPIISLLHQEATTDGNGTEIRIPVLEKDVYTFEKEMKRQLYYFENVIFEGFSSSENLECDYKIISGKTFLYRGKEYTNYAHVCLGRVAYPIDYNALGLNSGDYNIPIALKLEVGDINVTVSRENLDYSEQTIKILKKKLEDAKNEIIELTIKQYDNIVSLEDYFNYKTNFGDLYLTNDVILFVGNLIKANNVDLSNFKFSFTKMPNDIQLFSIFFDARYYGKKITSQRRSWGHSSNTNYFDESYGMLTRKLTNLYYVDGEFNRKKIKQSYLQNVHQTYYIIKKRNLKHTNNIHEINDMFNVQLDKIVDDNGQITPFVQSLIELQNEYFDIVKKYTKNYDELEVPESFIEEKKLSKEKISKEILNTTIPIRILNGHRGKERIYVSNLIKTKMPIFYGTKEDENKLRQGVITYAALFNDKNIVFSLNYDGEFNYPNKTKEGKKWGGIVFIMIAKNNYKYMEYCHNANHIDKIYRELFYRKEETVLDYFRTRKSIELFDNLSSLYTTTKFSLINKKYGEIINEIIEYISDIPKNYNNDKMMRNKDTLSNFFDVTNTGETKEQTVIINKIKMLSDLRNKNKLIEKYINIPYVLNNVENEFFELIKKLMVF